MNDLLLLQSFFGWASVVGIVILAISALMLLIFRKKIIFLHQKLMDIPESKLNESYFNFIAIFKVGLYIFFIIPYIALYCMNS
jgi:hypothetical protein